MSDEFTVDRGSPEYSVWRNMRTRCNNSKSRDYPNYGGRGIKVCGEWNDFYRFLLDMGKRPSAIHTIERTNNNQNYSKGNCVWATRQSQAVNKRMQANNRSGYTGVFFRRPNKWGAQINYKRIPYLLGYFNSVNEAALVRDKFIIENKFPHKLSGIEQ